MAIRQSNISELRYLKRKNLEQEAKIIGNMYRDQIHQQGIDCRYYKLNLKKFEEFRSVIDQNTILRHAYGYDDQPDYSVSADMITFMEVNNDILQLNKYGITPNADVSFVFDSNDFACALATRLGQFKEYKIDETEIDCEIPECNTQTSAEVFPYRLGLGYKENFRCGILSGKLSVEIDGYELGKETTVICHPYEHTDFIVDSPVNEYITKSFLNKIKSTDYIDSLVLLTYTVTKIKLSDKETRFYLHGKIHGSILFYDVMKLGKYLEKIHPDVGDVITIDFPDENNREQYEITEAFDKQLTQDGINPFLHKYVWKCTARRYVNSYEDIEHNEANERLEESFQYDAAVREQVAEKISIYDEGEDKVYGGYERKDNEHDHLKPDPSKHEKYDYIDDGTALDILRFASGSKLVTNGYDLLFVDVSGDAYSIAIDDYMAYNKDKALFEEGLQYLKATDTEVVFVNIEGRAFKIAEDTDASPEEMTLCLGSLFDKTLSPGSQNNDLDNFYKFNNTKTVLFGLEKNLFCRLATGRVIKLV